MSLDEPFDIDAPEPNSASESDRPELARRDQPPNRTLVEGQPASYFTG